MSKKKQKKKKKKMRNKEEFIPFTRDWMFAAVTRDPCICKGLLEVILPDENIEKIEIATPENPIMDEDFVVTPEAALKFAEDIHGVRFDAYCKSKNEWYDVEMQTVLKKPLGKRVRYYRCNMDYDCLEKNDDYEKLKTTYVIFICTFDYFGKDEPIYFFRSWDIENHLLLDDFAYTIVLNSKCSPDKVPDGLKELYAYINNPSNVGKSELVKNIDARVRKFNNTRWRTKQMTFEYYLKEEKKKGKAEGLEQGRNEGRTEGPAEGEKIGEARGEASKAREMARAMKNEGIDINTIIKVSGLPKEEIEKL